MNKINSTSIVVRADASSKIGTGHIFRCLALCDELRADGGDVLFICRDTPGHIGSLLFDRGYNVEFIPDVDDQLSDAKFCRNVLEKYNVFDWLWVDHYKLDHQWENQMRGSAHRMIATDDLADRKHNVDVLLDYTNTDSNAYNNLVPISTQKLIGHEYILLRREFFDIPKPKRNFDRVSNILVTFGGNDPLNMTSKVLDVVDNNLFSHLSINITVGTSNPKNKEICERAKSMNNVCTYLQYDRLSELMLDADLCLGAGGMTSWERNYLGLPSLVVALADNQIKFNEKMEQLGAIKNLGLANNLTVETLQSHILNAISDADWRRNCSNKASLSINGNGVFKLMKILTVG